MKRTTDAHGPLVMTSFLCPPALMKRLRRFTSERGLNRSELLRRATEAYLDRVEEPSR
jgi:hypothetical protein